MLSRHQFVSVAAASATLACTRVSFAAPTTLGHKERVDRALLGQDVDRPPFSLWHHFNKPTPEEEAQSLVEFHQRYDLLLTPTMPIPALPAGQDLNDPASERHWIDWSPFSYPFNMTRQPAASIPCGLTSGGLPIGLQIVGRLHDDARVLRAARAFEATQPVRRPPI